MNVMLLGVNVLINYKSKMCTKYFKIESINQQTQVIVDMYRALIGNLRLWRVQELVISIRVI